MGAHHRTEASTLLGVSTGSLRRLARAYEAAYGQLPTDGAGGRVYPDEALDLMQEARELVASRRVGTLEAAFKQLAAGAGELATPPGATPEALALELAASNARLDRLEAKLDAMYALLERIAAQPQEEEVKLGEAVTVGITPLLARLETQEQELRTLRAVMRAAQETPAESKQEPQEKEKRRPWWKLWG